VNSEDQQYLCNYLDAGGALYMEGADVGYNYDGTPLFDCFGASYLYQGSNNEVSSVTGQAGTITDGMNFTYNGGSDSHYSIDQLGTTSGSLLFECEAGHGRTVASDCRGFRTIISSFIMGALADGTGDNTKAHLMEQYLSFLDVDYTAQGEVNGYIIDEDTHQPVEGVIVSVGAHQCITDADGYFSLILDEGVYQLSCIHADYNTYNYGDILVVAGDSTVLAMQLDPLVNAGTPVVVKPFLRNYPNPFNPTTEICFSVGSEAVDEVTVAIYNIKGQMVQKMQTSTTSGLGSVHWDGDDATGKPVASGVYFCRIQAGATILKHKMVMMK
jgi:hypothetical protein